MTDKPEERKVSLRRHTTASSKAWVQRKRMQEARAKLRPVASSSQPSESDGDGGPSR